ncbi:MAG: tetraacyldisaccharide 4'-kinase [Pseudomonadota bacterium]|nr:tetraacyldisaccharide 4'-kinase [Pseudomonadota bacterium]
MTPPEFWYAKRGWKSFTLAPLGLLWNAGGLLRRRFGRKPYRAKVPVICVGNIVIGGAGKTPTAIAMAKLLLKEGHKPVFVTRGYGGTELGPLRVDPARHTVTEVGDEALLLAQVAPVWIGRYRAGAVREAEKEGSHVILDDGMQNASVRPDVTLLVVNGATGLGNECLIPAGPLRETLENALPRVSAAVLIGERDEKNITSRIHQPVFRARLRVDFPDNFPRNEKFVAFAGIGHPEKFYALCRRAGLTLLSTKDFADHHVFTATELQALQKEANAKEARLLSTEKDWVRLPPDFRARVLTLPVRLTFDYPAAVLRTLD